MTGVRDIWTVLKGVPDPEIPVVSVLDLGIVRSVEEGKVVITPTYSGCPATQFIEQSIREREAARGHPSKSQGCRTSRRSSRGFD